MDFRTPVIKELELDGRKVKVHAATYRQFTRAAVAENQMLATAQLCDETVEVEGWKEPASEVLTIASVNKAVAIAIGTDADKNAAKEEAF